MKVLHLLEHCPCGGVERLVLDLLSNHKYAKEKGVEFFWACNKRGDLYQYFIDSGTKQILYERNLPVDLIASRNLRKKVKEEKIDIVHVHFAVDALHAYLATFGTKTKVVFTHHGFFPHNKKDGIALGLLVKLVAHNTVVSEELKKYFTKKHKISGDISVVQNGVNLEKFWNAKEKDIRGELGLSNDLKILCMVGNFINTGRDQITVCKALNLLKQREDFVFLFIGRKSEENPIFFDECYDYCKKNSLLGKVFFLGGRVDIPEIMKGVDLYVYSSNHDTFGMTILEAMGSNVPVLLNDLDVFKEITENGKYCEMFQSKNVEQLAEKIQFFLDNPQGYTEKRDLAYRYVNEKFSVKKILDQYILVYKKIGGPMLEK